MICLVVCLSVFQMSGSAGTAAAQSKSSTAPPAVSSTPSAIGASTHTTAQTAQTAQTAHNAQPPSSAELSAAAAAGAGAGQTQTATELAHSLGLPKATAVIELSGLDEGFVELTSADKGMSYQLLHAFTPPVAPTPTPPPQSDEPTTTHTTTTTTTAPAPAAAAPDTTASAAPLVSINPSAHPLTPTAGAAPLQPAGSPASNLLTPHQTAKAFFPLAGTAAPSPAPAVSVHAPTPAPPLSLNGTQSLSLPGTNRAGLRTPRGSGVLSHNINTNPHSVFGFVLELVAIDADSCTVNCRENKDIPPPPAAAAASSTASGPSAGSAASNARVPFPPGRIVLSLSRPLARWRNYIISLTGLENPEEDPESVAEKKEKAAPQPPPSAPIKSSFFGGSSSTPVQNQVNSVASQYVTAVCYLARPLCFS